MFSLGLEFSLRKLFKVGATAFVAALSEIVLMIWIGYEIGRWFGWNSMDSLFLGAMLAISSTTIIVKALSELGMKGESFAQLVFGILIVEDILAHRDARAAVRHRADGLGERGRRGRHARQAAALHDGVAAWSAF